MSESSDARFRTLYAAHLRDLLGFALRRTARPEDAADVVADTFLVAWRRLERVPPGDEARLWLYGVCRTRAGQPRPGRRTTRPARGAAPGDSGQARVPDPAGDVAYRVSVEAAMERLRPNDRELLQLFGLGGPGAPTSSRSSWAFRPVQPGRVSLVRVPGSAPNSAETLPTRPGHVFHDQGAAEPDNIAAPPGTSSEGGPMNTDDAVAATNPYPRRNRRRPPSRGWQT